MYKTINTLILNGKHYDKDALEIHSRQILSDIESAEWEKNIALFVINWLDGKDDISVNTSGSTGSPKTINLKKDAMLQSAGMTISYLGIKNGSRALLCMPAEYIAGKMMIVRAMFGSWNLSCVKPAANPLAGLPEDSFFHFTAMTPMQLSTILSEKKSRELLNRMDTILIGGSAMPQTLVEKSRELKVNIYETYGMTETISHVALKKINGKGKSDFFSILPGESIGKDERGCLTISAPNINPETIITNDIVEIQDSTRFKFIGRYDNVINSGGIKLFPESIEKKLSPWIKPEFYITSMKDDKLGEKVVLVMAGNNFGKERQEELLGKCRNILNKYEAPKAIIFSKKFKRSAGGKLIRERF